ncbi:MAG: sugar nucleotide-binding protein [Bacteroidales bacterium]
MACWVRNWWPGLQPRLEGRGNFVPVTIKFLPEGYAFELMDISNEIKVDYIFDRYQPSLVINTAAMTQVDTCEEHKEDCWKVNVEAVEYLAAACNKQDAHSYS